MKQMMRMNVSILARNSFRKFGNSPALISIGFFFGRRVMEGGRRATEAHNSVGRAVQWLSSAPPTSTTTSIVEDIEPIFLHVGPSGDCWTGTSIFAAKHLQPDYVKSIPLIPPHDKSLCVDALLEILEDDHHLAHALYDQEALPIELLEKLQQSVNANDKEDCK